MQLPVSELADQQVLEPSRIRFSNNSVINRHLRSEKPPCDVPSRLPRSLLLSQWLDRGRAATFMACRTVRGR